MLVSFFQKLAETESNRDKWKRAAEEVQEGFYELQKQHCNVSFLPSNLRSIVCF